MVAPAGGGNQEVSYTININVTQAKKALEDILRAQDDVATRTQKLKQLIQDWANITGNSTNKVAGAFKILADEVKKGDAGFVTSANNLIKVDQALTPIPTKLKEAGEAAGEGPTGLAGAFSKLGTIGQFVFGSVLGITVVSTLKNIIEFFKQATAEALEFNQAQITLQVGARATQRMGQETTIAQYEQQIADLQRKFPIFSRVQAVEGYSNALILTRGLKLTKEQFQQLIDVSASASVVLGRDFGETATGIAKSLSSGWFEAAQRAGFLISRQSVVNQGLKIGIENAKNGYNAMTEYERAIAALSRYVEENGSIQQDVNVVMESQAGKVKIAAAAWDNFKVGIGQIFSPLKAGLSDFATAILRILDETNRGALTGMTQLQAWAGTLQRFLAEVKNFFDLLNPETWAKFDWKAAYQGAFDEAAKFTGLAPMLGDVGKQAGEALGTGIEDGMGGTNIAEAFQKLIYDIQDEMTKLRDRSEQLWIDYTRKIQDIIFQAQVDIANAIRKNNQDVANVNIEANNRRADAERKYRDNEITAEAKFQEQLRQLRTKFLFDLEDALRERDARQVLRLSRQYQMDKENATNEFKLAADARKRAYEEELRQLAEQRAERLRVLQESINNEILQIKQSEAIKLAQAQQNYVQELEDAQRASDARIKQQVLDFQRQYGLTHAQAQALVNLLNSYFGKNGPVVKIYDNLYTYIMKLVALTNAALGAIALPGVIGGEQKFTGGGGTLLPNVAHPGRAAGGTFFATRPTTVTYAEKEPEYATFTPVSKLGRYEQRVSGASNMGMGQGVGGNLRVVVELSPDLVASIIDDTMSGVTSVVKDINRER